MQWKGPEGLLQWLFILTQRIYQEKNCHGGEGVQVAWEMLLESSGQPVWRKIVGDAESGCWKEPGSPLSVEWNSLWQSLVGDVIAARNFMDRREEKEGESVLVRKGASYP